MLPIKQRHQRMVSDSLRTPLLQKAIKKIVKKDDVVFDLGCGTGVLTFEALKAGASKVYACDIDPHLHDTIKESSQKGFADKICFFHSLSSDVFLMEKVDVLLAETVGSFGLDENIVPFVIDARQRLLKKEGSIIPAKITVFVAPLETRHTGDSKPVSSGFQTLSVAPDDLLSKPKIYAEIDFKKIKNPFFDKEVIFKINRDGILGGFTGWFEVTWAEGIVTRTSPWDPPTHWEQGFLKNKKALKLKAGDSLTFRLRMFPKEELYSTVSAFEWGFDRQSRFS